MRDRNEIEEDAKDPFETCSQMDYENAYLSLQRLQLEVLLDIRDAQAKYLAVQKAYTNAIKELIDES